MQSETERLLPSTTAYGSIGDESARIHKNVSLGSEDANDGERFDNVPQNKRQLGGQRDYFSFLCLPLIGLVSCVFLIFNRIIGTGYANRIPFLLLD